MSQMFTMIWKELVQVSNRARFAVQKALIAAAVGAFFLLMSYEYVYDHAYANYQTMARFGAEFYMMIVPLLAALLSLAAMVFGSGIVVAEKVRHRLPILLVTPLGAPAIIGSKAVSIYGRVGLGLLVAMPVMTMLQLFGGVDRDMVIYGLLFIASNVWLYGAIGLLSSVFARGAAGALALSAVLAVLWNLAPLFYLLAWRLWVGAAGFSGMTNYNPFSSISFFNASAFYAYSTIVAGRMAMSPLMHIVAHAAINAALGAVILGVSFINFRRMAAKVIDGGSGRRRETATPSPKADASSKPRARAAAIMREPLPWFDAGMIAKETRGWLPWRPTFPLLWLAVPWLFVLFIHLVFDESINFMDADFQWVMFLAEAMGFLFLMSLIASTRVSREKEAGTLQTLVITRLGAFHVLAGKAAAVIIRQAVPMSVLALHLALIMWLVFPSALDAWGTALGFAVSVLFSVSLGIYFSLAARKTTTAVILTALTWGLGVYATVGLFAMIMSGGGASEETFIGTTLGASLVLAAAAVPYTLAFSRRRGCGPWLSLASYSTLATALFLLVGVATGAATDDDLFAPMGFLPGASLAPWDWRINGISVCYLALPVQCALLLWMAISSVVTFEAQAKRGN